MIRRLIRRLFCSHPTRSFSGKCRRCGHIQKDYMP